MKANLGSLPNPPTPATNSRSMARITLLLIFGIETVFFSTLLASYIAIRNGVRPDLGAGWAVWLIPAVNTFLLVVSSLTATLGKRAIAHGHREELRFWLGITLLLGLVFVVGQIYDFSHSGMSPSDTAFGGVFFALIGFHALHVLAGVVILALIELRVLLGDFSAQRYTLVEVGTWFWYFVTGIWLVLYTSLYLV